MRATSSQAAQGWMAAPVRFGFLCWNTLTILALLGLLAQAGCQDSGVAKAQQEAGEAKAAAATRKNCGERGQGELSFSLPGDPRLAAEGRLSIHLRPGIPTDWRIKRVEHRLGPQGYVSQVECERLSPHPESVT